MVRAFEVEDGVTDDDVVLFVLADELASERRIAELYDDTLAYPLPELGLRRPVFFAVVTHYQRVLLFLFSLKFTDLFRFFLVVCHLFILSTPVITRPTPSER